MEQLLSFAEKLETVRGFTSLAKISLRFVRQQGGTHVRYHHLPPRGALDYRPYQSVLNAGLPKEWIRAYRANREYLVDPMPRYALDTGRILRWMELPALFSLTSAERSFMSRWRAAKLGDGYAFPVYGPHGRNGFFGVGCGCEVCTFSAQTVRRLSFAVQAVHMKYCELIRAETEQVVTLSDREREILVGLTRGSSNKEIADQLSLSPNTVDTYVRRLFGKLKVADRVTASLRGMALGLID